MSSRAFIGIDFGTSTSSVAWLNPKTGQAEVLLNAEGEPRTPSVVYYGEHTIVVGKHAEQMLEDDQEWPRVVPSVKRDIASPSVIALPGRRVKPVQVATEIFAKLKRDAEDLHFHGMVERAVVTVPAVFSQVQRDKIKEAATTAGIKEVELLEEPVAAAIACLREGLNIGDRVLVYDLGGGTFDLAVLVREDETGFRLALEPKGIAHCGGDDFDRALYDHCDEEARVAHGVGINDKGLDLRFLAECRKRKENLSQLNQVTVSAFLPGNLRFRHTVTRAAFEELIAASINRTATLTGNLVAAARHRAYPVDTAILIGGSSRIPLVAQSLSGTLPFAPQRSQHQDVAVALGAAYHGWEIWRKVTPFPQPTPAAAPERVITFGDPIRADEEERQQEEAEELLDEPWANSTEFPPINIWRGPEGVIVTAEIPGIKPDDIDLTIDQNTLTIKVRSEPEAEEPEGSPLPMLHADALLYQRTAGSFARTVTLPFSVDTDQIIASAQNGILTVELPRLITA